MPPPLMSHWQFLANVLVALAMGIAIGLERQWRQHSAGLRTNALVAVGAAMFVSITLLMGDTANPTRIASYIVSGLGFLGGGVILREGLTVRGLSTAATIWCTGAVGTLAGAGYPIESVIGTAAVLGIHFGLRPIAERIEIMRKMAPDVETSYRLRVRCRPDNEAVIRTILLRHISSKERMSVQGLSTDETNPAAPVVVAEIFATRRNDRVMEELVARVSIEPDVSEVSWTRTAM